MNLHWSKFQQTVNGLALLILVSLLVAVFWFVNDSPGFKDGTQAAWSEYRFTNTDCWFDPAGFYLPVACYELQVMGEASQQLYQLPVVVLNSQARPGPLPLVYLGGGPGSGLGLARGDIAYWFSWYQNQGLTGPLVLMDYRATGLSSPQFHCAPMDNIRQRSIVQPRADDSERLWRATQECFVIWNARGFRAQDFSITANTQDLQNVLEGLEYELVDVYGVSYGTRVAASLALNDPQRVNHLILDSPVNDATAGTNYWPAKLQSAFERYFRFCDNSSLCQINRQQLLKLIGYLQTPIPIEVRHWQSDSTITVDLTDQLLISLLFSSFYQPQSVARLDWRLTPELFIQSNEFTALLEAYINREQSQGFSSWVYYANQCASNLPYRAEIIASQSIASLWQPYIQHQAQYDICSLFDVPVNIKEATPLATAQDPLVLVGELDPITPPTDAFSLVAGFGRGEVVEVRGVGHGVLASNACEPYWLSHYLKKGQVPECSPPALMVDF